MNEKMRFLNLGLNVPIESAKTILEIALKARIELSHSCGGMGSCGTCRIRVVEGLSRLEPKNEVEAEITAELKFEANERLACQSRPCPGLVVEVPEPRI